MDFLQRCVSAIQACDKPVIAAVHGICFGAGLDLISACDVRLCAEGTVFSIKVRLGSGGVSSFRGSSLLTDLLRTRQEVDIGLAADIGSLQRLPRVTSNASLLYELALTARTFGPAEAEKLGLVSRTVTGKGFERVRHEAIELAKVVASEASLDFFGVSEVVGSAVDPLTRPPRQIARCDLVDQASPQLLARAHRPGRVAVHAGLVSCPVSCFCGF
jgi:delta(3,5)-delta(2,4)-dienoyl-CoA isomerase